MIKPTIGRVVLFHPSENTGEMGFTPPPPGQPCAAIIAHVHNDRLVNLAVFDVNGRSHSRSSVCLVQPEDEAPADGYYCRWMDYQLGQAAKTEALEAQLKDRA